MGLVVVAAIRRECGPGNGLFALQSLENLLEAKNATETFGAEADLAGKTFNEATVTDSGGMHHVIDSVDAGLGREELEGELDGGIRICEGPVTLEQE